MNQKTGHPSVLIGTVWKLKSKIKDKGKRKGKQGK
jgi:hypothetical protein